MTERKWVTGLRDTKTGALWLFDTPEANGVFQALCHRQGAQPPREVFDAELLGVDDVYGLFAAQAIEGLYALHGSRRRRAA